MNRHRIQSFEIHPIFYTFPALGKIISWLTEEFFARHV
jgi:hypothetical protein